MPIGYLVTTTLVAFFTLFALAPLRRPPGIRRLSWRFGFLINELPFVALYWLLASTLLAISEGDIDSPVGWVAFVVAVLAAAGLAVVGWRGLRASPVIDRALRDGLGVDWRAGIDAGLTAVLRRRRPLVAWVREHGNDYGADTSVVFVAGSSAGGHLAAMAALTPNDPAFQPGFESADTAVTAAISLYGYHGTLSNVGPPSSPLAYVGSGAPPFFIAHGVQDTLVLVENARLFAEKLRSASSNPVVYAELPGGQHSFGLFHSLRFEAVVDGIEAFTAWVRSQRGATPPAATNMNSSAH